MQKTTVTVGKVVRTTILSILLVFAVSLIVGYFIGFRAFIVDGASMEPIIHYRSLAITKPIEAKDIKIGYALTYTSAESTSVAVRGMKAITHRVIRIKDANNNTVAEFRDKSNYDSSWEENGAYLVEHPELGVDVVAWYSGEVFDETYLFITQGTDRSKNPFESTATEEEKTHSQIYGHAIFSIPNMGNVILFIQQNIILVIATFGSLILLYNVVYSEIKAKK